MRDKSVLAQYELVSSSLTWRVVPIPPSSTTHRPNAGLSNKAENDDICGLGGAQAMLMNACCESRLGCSPIRQVGSARHRRQQLRLGHQLA